MKLAPVLFLDTIEPALAFWVDRLGFAQTVAVPEDDALGFVILEKEGVEVMLQTWNSVERDAPQVLAGRARTATGSSLFIEVDDFDDLRARLEGAEIVMPERVTFYGMREIGAVAPGGHIVVFAKREG